MCSLKAMDKVGDAATLEEGTTKEGKFKTMLFLLQADEYIYGQLFEDIRKS